MKDQQTIVNTLLENGDNPLFQKKGKFIYELEIFEQLITFERIIGEKEAAEN